MTKRVTAIALVLFALAALILLIGNAASAQTLPPKAADESYVVVGPGLCEGLIEIGTYKPDLDKFWTRNPRKFVEPCEIFVEKTFVGRYRLGARCVNRETKVSMSQWVKGLSGLDKPFPEECPGFAPGQPINPALCPVE